MNVRKFSAATSREAIRLLRDALGSDAVILSNKNVDGRVEILAMADDMIDSIKASTTTTESLSDGPKFPPRLELKSDVVISTEQSKSVFEKSVSVRWVAAKRRTNMTPREIACGSVNPRISPGPI